jgi:hypothetical protein
MRWVGYIAPVGEAKSVYNILVEKPRGRRILVVNERIILKYTVKE